MNDGDTVIDDFINGQKLRTFIGSEKVGIEVWNGGIRRNSRRPDKYCETRKNVYKSYMNLSRHF